MPRAVSDHPVARQIAMGDKALNDEDFDTAEQMYTEDAVMIVRPGLQVHGRAAIRKAHERIAAFLNHSLDVSQGAMTILETRDTALVLAETFVRSTGKDGRVSEERRRATYVFRRMADGAWRCALDNSYGTDLLDDPDGAKWVAKSEPHTPK